VGSVATEAPPTRAQGWPVERGGRPWWVVPALAVLVVLLLRLPYLRAPAGPDEGGYLAVAGQWHAGGSSLYGSYWVDRPPLLISLFALASGAGGLLPLRVLGCLAAVVTVAASAWTARRLGGDRGAACAAVVAGALLVSPLMGPLEVNGELLAAPFLAVSMAGAVASLGPAGNRLPAAALAGACAVAAVLVKQNLADGCVFAALTWLAAWRLGELDGRGLLTRVAAATAGGLVLLGVVAGVTVTRGTSLVGVYEATYPFRIAAAKVIAASRADSAGHRLERLVEGWALTGMLLLVVLFAWSLLRDRRSAAAWGMAGTFVFSAVSILAGGSYWHHYLVEMIPTASLMAGVLARRAGRRTTALTAMIAGLAVGVWGGALPAAPAAPGTVVGSAVARSARAGDSIASIFGDPDIVLTSGLPSRYPQLWSLPARTLDGDMHLLRSTLAGARRPTWVVVRGATTLRRLREGRVAPLLSRDYRVVGVVCSRTVYLERGRTREPLTGTSRCPRGSSAWDRTRAGVRSLWPPAGGRRG
jgi:hypothetical protein